MDSPRRPLQSIGTAPPSSDRFTGALVVVAASLVAVIRLKGEDLRPSPRVTSVIADSVALAKAVLREVIRQ